MYKYVYSFSKNRPPIYACFYGSSVVGYITVESENKYVVNKQEFSTLKAAKNFLENHLSYITGE